MKAIRSALVMGATRKLFPMVFFISLQSCFAFALPKLGDFAIYESKSMCRDNYVALGCDDLYKPVNCQLEYKITNVDRKSNPGHIVYTASLKETCSRSSHNLRLLEGQKTFTEDEFNNTAWRATAYLKTCDGRYDEYGYGWKRDYVYVDNKGYDGCSYDFFTYVNIPEANFVYGYDMRSSYGGEPYKLIKWGSTP